jgi:hypothetical protein
LWFLRPTRFGIKKPDRTPGIGSSCLFSNRRLPEETKKNFLLRQLKSLTGKLHHSCLKIRVGYLKVFNDSAGTS